MNGFKTVFSKEWSRIFRDKKLVFSLFILPVIITAALLGLVFFLMDMASKEQSKHIAKIQIQNAPARIVELLKDSKDEIKFLSKDENLDSAKIEVQNGNLDLIVVFPENFDKEVSDGKYPQIKTFYNPSENYSSNARNSFISVAEQYRSEKIKEKYGNEESIKMFSIDSDNQEGEIVDQKKASGKALGGIVPYFITILLMAGAMSIGADSIAGEKERGTLASLLMCPVKRSSIAFAKVCTLSLVSLISAAIYVVVMFAGYKIIGANVGMTANFSVSLDASQIAMLITLIMEICVLYVAIIALVSVFAKTVKEAQSYITPIYFIVILAGLVTMFLKSDPSETSFLIPVYNVSIAFKAIFEGTLTAVQFAEVSIVTIVLIVICISAISKAFKDEKKIFTT